MDAGIYNKCTFIPKVYKKEMEVHIKKSWWARADEPS